MRTSRQPCASVDSPTRSPHGSWGSSCARGGSSRRSSTRCSLEWPFQQGLRGGLRLCAGSLPGPAR
eukprot:9213277-Alexandrium_andersonii.AAC.1